MLFPGIFLDGGLCGELKDENADELVEGDPQELDDAAKGVGKDAKESMHSKKAPPKMERRKGSRGRGLERGIPLSLVEILTEHIGESFLYVLQH